MSDLVQLLNENGFLADGVSYESVWISQSLNRPDVGRVYTLPHIDIVYSASETSSIEVSASGDGGVTFPVTRVLALTATWPDPEALAKVACELRVSGWDLRVRIRFDQTQLSHIHVVIPPLIERGKHFNAVR